jgi:hypothetical protein
MEPLLWDRIQEIYHSALPMPPMERDEFVARTCGSNPILVREVISLLEADASSGDFLQSSVFEVGLRIITSKNPIKSEEASSTSGELIGHDYRGSLSRRGRTEPRRNGDGLSRSRSQAS